MFPADDTAQTITARPPVWNIAPPAMAALMLGIFAFCTLLAVALRNHRRASMRLTFALALALLIFNAVYFIVNRARHGWYPVEFSHISYFVMAVPVVMGTVAFARGDDALLKDAIYVGASLAVNTALTVGLKYAVGRERPYDRYPGVLQVPYPEGSPSMPSGHTSLAFATATSLTLKYPKWYVAVPCYAWACSVGYSRMNLGVHYPTDVLAGAVLGAGSAYVTYLLNEWFWGKKMKDKKIIWY